MIGCTYNNQLPPFIYFWIDFIELQNILRKIYFVRNENCKRIFLKAEKNNLKTVQPVIAILCIFYEFSDTLYIFLYILEKIFQIVYKVKPFLLWDVGWKHLRRSEIREFMVPINWRFTGFGQNIVYKGH